jgi:hypothetical protein
LRQNISKFRFLTRSFASLSRFERKKKRINWSLYPQGLTHFLVKKSRKATRKNSRAPRRQKCIFNLKRKKHQRHDYEREQIILRRPSFFKNEFAISMSSYNQHRITETITEICSSMLSEMRIKILIVYEIKNNR